MRHTKRTTRPVRNLTLLCAVMLASSVGQAEAVVAMGPYLDFSSGSGKLEWDSDNSDFDVDTASAAVGLSLDATRGEQANFNYRLNIAIEGQNLKDESDVTMKMGGIILENVFGFALISKPDMRWWIGPLLRFALYSGETDDYHNSYGERCKTEANLFEYGAGMATGITLKVGPHAYLAPSAGVRFIGTSGTGTIKNLDLHSQYDDDFSGNLTNFFVYFSLLFD